MALLGREERALRQVEDALPGVGECWEVDVTDDRGMARAGADIRARLGPASVVVANAGVAEGGPFAESDPAVWRRVVEVNPVGGAATARTSIGDPFDTCGCFLQVASLASPGAAPTMSAYCASKAGVGSFAHALRAEVAHRRVDVGAACTDWTDTGMVRDADEYAVLRELRGHMPRPARKVYPSGTWRAGWSPRPNGVARRSTCLRWLRSARLIRAAMPPVVTMLSRREPPRLAAVEPFRPTGLPGSGGRADRAASRSGRGRPGGVRLRVTVADRVSGTGAVALLRP